MRGDPAECVCGEVEIGREGLVWRGVVGSEGGHATCSSQDGTKMGVATAAETNAFTADGIFLRGEFECNEGGRGKVGSAVRVSSRVGPTNRVTF